MEGNSFPLSMPPTSNGEESWRRHCRILGCNYWDADISVGMGFLNSCGYLKEAGGWGHLISRLQECFPIPCWRMLSYIHEPSSLIGCIPFLGRWACDEAAVFLITGKAPDATVMWPHWHWDTQGPWPSLWLASACSKAPSLRKSSISVQNVTSLMQILEWLGLWGLAKLKAIFPFFRVPFSL